MKKLVIFVILCSISIISFAEKKIAISSDKSQIALVDVFEKNIPCSYELKVDTIETRFVDVAARPYLTIPIAWKLLDTGYAPLNNKVTNSYIFSKTEKRHLEIKNGKAAFVEDGVNISRGKGVLLKLILLFFIAYVAQGMYWIQTTSKHVFLKFILIVFAFSFLILSISEVVFGSINAFECSLIIGIFSLMNILQILMVKKAMRFRTLHKEKYYSIHTDNEGTMIMRKAGDSNYEGVIFVDKNYKVLKGKPFNRVIEIPGEQKLAIVFDDTIQSSTGVISLMPGKKPEVILPQSYKRILLASGFLKVTSMIGFSSIYSLKKMAFIVGFYDATLIIDEENDILEIRHEDGQIEHVSIREKENAIIS